MTPQNGASLIQFYPADIAALTEFLAAQSGRPVDDVKQHLEWFTLGNPAWSPQLPFGCGLRTENGAIAGCLLYSPQKFRFLDTNRLLLGASLFYIEPSYRGNGGVIFLKYFQQGKQAPLFCNSANAEAATLWKSCGGRPIPDSDHELLAVRRWSPVLEEALQRHFGNTLLQRAGSQVVSPFVAAWKRLNLGSYESSDLLPLSTPEEVMELPIHGSSSRLTGARDAEFIRWRYFTGPDKTVGVYAFRSTKTAPPRLVTVNVRPRGHRKQIRSLNLLDIYPEPGGEDTLRIAHSLLDRYREEVDVLTLRNIDAQRQSGLIDAGFLRRPFENPNGWVFDRHHPMPTPEWYFVPADCDWII